MLKFASLLSILLLMLSQSNALTQLELDPVCTLPLVVFVDGGETYNSLKCVSNTTPQTLIQQAGLAHAAVSPNSEYIAYVILEGSYLEERTQVNLYSLDTKENFTLRAGDGHVVLYWTEENHLLIQAYAEFPRPVSQVFDPDFLFEYDPVIGRLTQLDVPTAIYRGYIATSQQFIFADSVQGAFFYSRDGEITSIEFPNEISNPFRISVSSNSSTIAIVCDSSTDEICISTYDIETDIYETYVLDASEIESSGVSSMEISPSGRYIAMMVSQRLAVYDLLEHQIVYSSRSDLSVFSGYTWLYGTDELLFSYLIEMNDLSTGSNLFILDPTLLSVQQLTDTSSLKTIR